MERNWTFDVGWCDRYPIEPDKYVSRVTVLATSYGDAMATAAGMVMRPGVVMATSTTYVE